MSASASSPQIETAPTAWDLRRYLGLRFGSVLAMQVQTVAVGWQVYDLTHDPFSLGYVGLFQFLPMVLLVLPAGDLADHADRRFVLIGAYLIQAAASGLLLALTLTGTTVITPFYWVVALFGVARGLSMPSLQSFLPYLVTPERLPKAVASSSSVTEIATIAGPALGGVLYLLGPSVTYGAAFVLFLAAAVTMVNLRIRRRAARTAPAVGAFTRVTEGIRYVRRNPILLGAISLDLFAVLFGGATALLPIFASDILHVGPTGLGLLRSAPAIGAAVMAFALARRPLKRHLGLGMFACVGLFGVAIIIFGLSGNFLLSLAALIAAGSMDMVSVYVRNTVTQLATPDHMRGRVGAVSSLFIGTSNELGEFESGITAGWFGTIPAVVIGGLGTLTVVGLWMWLFPPLRKVNGFEEVVPV